MKEATSWPDAGIAIAGIGFVTAVSLALIWQIFATLRSHLARQAGGDAQGERA
jgi:hypothetical protein